MGGRAGDAEGTQVVREPLDPVGDVAEPTRVADVDLLQPKPLTMPLAAREVVE